MKNILLYIAFFSFITINAQIQDETFSSTTIPSGWSATNSTNCSWQFGYTGSMPGAGYSNPTTFSTGAAAFIDDSCSDDGYTVQLVGPAIDLISQGVISAAIEVVYNHQTFGNDGNFTIQVWDGEAWQTVLFVDGDSPTASNTGQNATATIDVTSYINSTFKVKFIYEDQNQLTWGLAIDNYKLLNTATAGTEELLSKGFSYYPNPIVNNLLTLSALEDISLVTVYNSIGQRVLLTKPLKTQSEIQMDNLSAGVYMVHVVIGTKQGSFKIIKQ